MSKSPISGPGLAMVGIGSVLIYAGVKGYSALAVVQNLVSGKPIATNVSVVNDVSQTFGTVENTDLGNTEVSPGGILSGGAKGNKGIGKELAAAYGWSSGAEWDALDKLWTRESSWNNRADNPSSHAYGIPQALPHTKMPQAAWPESAGGSSDARTQIAWGLAYIRQRYGSPTMAWAHEQANDWY